MRLHLGVHALEHTQEPQLLWYYLDGETCCGTTCMCKHPQISMDGDMVSTHLCSNTYSCQAGTYSMLPPMQRLQPQAKRTPGTKHCPKPPGAHLAAVRLRSLVTQCGMSMVGHRGCQGPDRAFACCAAAHVAVEACLFGLMCHNSSVADMLPVALAPTGARPRTALN